MRRDEQAVARPSKGRRRSGQLIVLAAGALSAMGANALQLVEASDGVSTEAILSIKEPTRIRIEHAAITDVFGNIRSSQCAATTADDGHPQAPSPGTAPSAPAVNPAGDVVVECDRGRGEIYVRPVGDSGRPINLFVASATATYTLVLRQADTPADTIVIRDRTPAPLRRPSVPARDANSGPAPSHVRAMKAMLVAMASDRVPQDIRVEEVARPVMLWREARFTLLRTYEGRGLRGEAFALQNISSAAMRLAEQEFDGADKPVLGVAIEQHQLDPGATTRVYVIRREESP
jgi:conjugal transfer pilus assembly protein TraK